MIRRMAIAVVGIGAVLTLAQCGSDSTEPAAEVYTTTLNGANERPTPTNSTATGTSKVTINSTARTLTYDLSFTGFTSTAQHIHGPIVDPAVAAGVIVALTPGTNQVITESQLTGAIKYDSLVALIRAGKTYVNVHSATFPSGEIRGDLKKQ